MIKATVDESAISLEVKGSITEILAELTFIISGINDGLPAQHKKIFRRLLTHAVNAPNSPVWRDCNDQ